MQNNFMFAMFQDKLQTVKTKEFARSCVDGDARQSWAQVVNFHTQSSMLWEDALTDKLHDAWLMRQLANALFLHNCKHSCMMRVGLGRLIG